MKNLSQQPLNQLISRIDKLTTRSNELSNRQVTANASGFYSPSGKNKGIRIHETYPLQWGRLLSTSSPKAFPLTLSSWFTNFTATGNADTNPIPIANLGGVPLWLLTQGSLFNEYRFMSDPILHWVPAGGTQQPGQIAFGLLRDPNDLFRGRSNSAIPVSYIPLSNSSNLPISSTDILTMEYSYAGPISLPFSHRFPLERGRRMNTWMRQDASLIANDVIPATVGFQSVPSANTRLDCPFGSICIQTDSDIFTSTNLGRLFIEYDIEFRSRVIPALQTNRTDLSAVLIPSSQLKSGKTFIGIQADSQRETGQKSYRRSTQLVDLLSKVKLLASNQLFVGFDIDRIEGQLPIVKILSDKKLSVKPKGCSLNLPREEEFNNQFEWSFTLVPLAADSYGIEITSDGEWSGELSWIVS
jgi:hypothetical protein